MQDSKKYPPVESACFNLWNEPWIDVLFCDGTNGLLSLSEVFENACEIKDICEELPIQDISVLRLLICVIHSSEHVTINKWKEWYENGSLPLDKIKAYRDEHYGEFYLFHPSHPFMQVADLNFAKEDKSIEGTNVGLLYDYPTEDRIMRCRNDESVAEISCAEAARLLITAQNYDVCGVHTPMEGDASNSGKAYPKMASLSHNTVIVLEGDNLFETLMYNTVPLDAEHVKARKRGIDVAADYPPWDPKHVSNVEGPCSILCRQSRRIRLIPNFLFHPESIEHPSVIGTMVGVGEEVPWNDLFSLEDMSIFRYFEDKQNGSSYYKPARFSKQPYKEIYSRIIGRVAYHAGEGAAAQMHAVGSIGKEHSDKLSNNMLFAYYLSEDEDIEDFERDRMLSFRTVSVYYGTMESVIDRIDDDRTRVSPLSISGRDKNKICASIDAAIENIDSIEFFYRGFLKNIEKIYAPSSLLEPPRDEMNKLKVALEATFQSWLEQDVPTNSSDKDSMVRLWKERVWSAVQNIVKDYISTSVPVRDFIGFCDMDGKERSVCKEEARFYSKVKGTLFEEGKNGQRENNK